MRVSVQFAAVIWHLVFTENMASIAHLQVWKDIKRKLEQNDSSEFSCGQNQWHLWDHMPFLCCAELGDICLCLLLQETQPKRAYSINPTQSRINRQLCHLSQQQPLNLHTDSQMSYTWPLLRKIHNHLHAVQRKNRQPFCSHRNQSKPSCLWKKMNYAVKKKRVKVNPFQRLSNAIRCSSFTQQLFYTEALGAHSRTVQTGFILFKGTS